MTLPYGPLLYEATWSLPAPTLHSVCERMCQSPLRSVHLGPRLVESGRLKSSPGVGVGVGVLVGVLVEVGVRVDVGVLVGVEVSVGVSVGCGVAVLVGVGV